MTTNIGNLNSFSYAAPMAGGASKLYVPVSKSALLYSHFDHVSGVAAGNGENGVSISKIRILNSMIDRLSAIKNEPKESITDISDEQAEILIKNYQKQIQQTVQQTPYLLSGARPLAGEIFAIDA